MLQDGSRNYDAKSRYHNASRLSFTDLQDHDIAGRHGGDEFALAFVNCGVEEANTIADGICSRIRSLELVPIANLRVTSSVGCAVLLDPLAWLAIFFMFARGALDRTSCAKSVCNVSWQPANGLRVLWLRGRSERTAPKLQATTRAVAARRSTGTNG